MHSLETIVKRNEEAAERELRERAYDPTHCLNSHKGKRAVPVVWRAGTSMSTPNATRYRFYVGLVQRGGQPVSDEMQTRMARMVAEAYDGGCTMYPATGVWRGAVEPTLVFEVVTGAGGRTHQAVASALAKLGDQECVLWTSEPITSGLEG